MFEQCPFYSTYRKAQEAKDKLIQIVDERIEKGNVRFVNQMGEAGFSREMIENHLLIFMCALIPKAVASVLTNVVESSHLWYDRYVTRDGSVDEADLEAVLLEVIRLWPPFVGGLKGTLEDIELGDFHIPKGYVVFLNSSLAHRDPEVFPKAEEFLPERWSTFNKNDRDKMLGFGAGVHRCIGEKLSWKFLIRVLQRFIRTYSWNPEVFAKRTKELKYVPISRPLDQTPLEVCPR